MMSVLTSPAPVAGVPPRASSARAQYPGVRKHASAAIVCRPAGPAQDVPNNNTPPMRCQTSDKIVLTSPPMLRFLSIRNLAVIDRLELEFEPGLNVLTGETGAGKSILVGAVGLLVGGRASADLVRTGEDTATVEAIFDTPQGDELIVRREVSDELIVRREVS